MSLYDYEISKKITAEGYPFYALVMAAMRQASSYNAWALAKSFPDTWDEIEARYDARGGLLEGEVSIDGTYRMMDGELVDIDICDNKS